MDFETESQKKKYGAGVFGDVYAITMMLPKDLDKMDPPPSPPPFQLRFQLPGLNFRIHLNFTDHWR
ncbi:hypothetical protein JCGZ_22578 [Jatropha curcas]|uniref:Uncharacterized protein n=1 Tax=Jatropha curcas TaxID=180498 RepID=A0A067JQC5_JATCU|nr:hypothetical protein JCGZ_22578 [Jatropha curcas]